MHICCSLSQSATADAWQGSWCLGAGVYFGQLLGMADHLSFTLGRAGYRIHKIVPYGPVHETLQYLIRSGAANTLVTRGLPYAKPSCPDVVLGWQCSGTEELQHSISIIAVLVVQSWGGVETPFSPSFLQVLT